MAGQQHPFSPILNEERLRAAIDYVTERALTLAREVLGQDLGIDTLCFFAHTPEEYEFLQRAVHARGPKSKLAHGMTQYVDANFTVRGQHIKLFGVRKPDPTRPQVGYGDYPVPNYAEYKKLAKSSPYITEIRSGRGEPLIELHHPDFDILGFVHQANH